jgi:hypothetical protein
MPAILTALRCALCDLARPRVLLWMVAPLAGALLVWGVAAALWWEPLTAVVAGWLPSWFPGHWSGRWEAGIRSFFAALLTAGLLAPLVMATALCVTAFFVMPVLVEVVAASRYPQLARRGGGTLAGSVANTLFALARFAVLWLVTLPLWLTGIGALLAPARQRGRVCPAGKDRAWPPRRPGAGPGAAQPDSVRQPVCAGLLRAGVHPPVPGGTGGAARRRPCRFRRRRRRKSLTQVYCRRSNTAAMPWPPPIHMVTSA